MEANKGVRKRTFLVGLDNRASDDLLRKLSDPPSLLAFTCIYFFSILAVNIASDYAAFQGFPSIFLLLLQSAFSAVGMRTLE